jgi:hypothetical protein
MRNAHLLVAQRVSLFLSKYQYLLGVCAKWHFDRSSDGLAYSSYALNSSLKFRETVFCTTKLRSYGRVLPKDSQKQMLTFDTGTASPHGFLTAEEDYALGALRVSVSHLFCARQKGRHNKYGGYYERKYCQPRKPDMVCAHAEQCCGGHGNDEVTKTSSKNLMGIFSKISSHDSWS